MQQPDANGYINVTWPSKTVPHGGIFHTKVVEPSSSHKQFLKVLLDESKLSIAQRQKSAWKLREENEQKKPQLPQPQNQTQTTRPRTSKRRSLSCIRESGIYEMEPYLPQKRGEDREQLKERLANAMTYGDTPEQKPPVQQPKSVEKKNKLPGVKDMKNDILTQIRERAEWLAEMEYLGHAAPHREIIHDQIAERLRALNALGIDSVCSSARSTKSGFSTLRSREDVQKEDKKKSAHSNCSSARTLNAKEPKKCYPAKPKLKDEDVIGYNNVISAFQYSPRRRL